MKKKEVQAKCATLSTLSYLYFLLISRIYILIKYVPCFIFGILQVTHMYYMTYFVFGLFFSTVIK